MAFPELLWQRSDVELSRRGIPFLVLVGRRTAQGANCCNYRWSALRPFVPALDAERAREFPPAYVNEIRPHDPLRADGQVLLRFPRLFVVAIR